MTETLMWQAVADRDRFADGQFVYAVSSTGVYCRPSCPSRRPHRDRVAFFDSPARAERAGFRPCRRCRPLDAAANDPWAERIRRCCEQLSRAGRRLTLKALAARVGGSPYHLQRNFKRLVGLTPQQYAEASRLGAVKRRLRSSADVTTAMLEAGYQSSGRFYERAAPRLGMTPSQYKAGAAGALIRYAIVDAGSFGKLLVAATARGVCTVSFGRSRAELEDALAREYPGATLDPDDGAMADAVTQLLEHLAGSRPRIDLPLDVRATAFQWQVWTALMKIPYGETRSYSDVAAALGRPGAARAVARACAANPVALAVPCHRVVPAVGGSGEYRWGAARKKALLAAEGKMPAR